MSPRTETTLGPLDTGAASINGIVTTERDVFEAALVELFPSYVTPTERSWETISSFKDGSFAMGFMGVMLYTNGYNLRSASTRYPNGLVYCDGRHVFGVGFFSKEGHLAKHLHVVAPKGPQRVEAVGRFVADVRAAGLTDTTVYVRHLPEHDRDAFLAVGYEPIDVDPWHPRAPEEDETFPNRVYDLDELFAEGSEGELEVVNLRGADHRRHRTKNRLAYQRFQNFLERHPALSYEIHPYEYTTDEQRDALSVVDDYFRARRERGNVVGSTAEDYFAIVSQRPQGGNGEDWFAYLGSFRSESGYRRPMTFFAGERVASDRAALYCTITLRFPELLGDVVRDERGFTAIPQYTVLSVFRLLRRQGIRFVDIGGSEVVGLDDQKRQLGGRAEKTHWVVAR